MRGMQERHQMLTRNLPEDSGQSLRGFQRMFEKIPGEDPGDSKECLRRCWGMFQKIAGMFKKILRIVGKDSENVVQEDFGECFQF